MSTLTRSIARAGAVAVAAGMSVAAAPAAQAADGPAISDVHCESGVNRYFCDADVSGGVAPVAVTWSPASSGHCAGGQRMTVTATATDATGTSSSKSYTFTCSSGPWL
jgi:hypothetical protein